MTVPPPVPTCPTCGKRTYVGGVEVEAKLSSDLPSAVSLKVFYFCDRTKGCELSEIPVTENPIPQLGTSQPW